MICFFLWFLHWFWLTFLMIFQCFLQHFLETFSCFFWSFPNRFFEPCEPWNHQKTISFYMFICIRHVSHTTDFSKNFNPKNKEFSHCFFMKFITFKGHRFSHRFFHRFLMEKGSQNERSWCDLWQITFSVSHCPFDLWQITSSMAHFPFDLWQITYSMTHFPFDLWQVTFSTAPKKQTPNMKMVSPR